jgi:sugar phosphate isomerase/epimerase
MSRWQQQGSLWCLTPPQPRGLVEFIGGSYLAASPQLSYRRLLEALARLGLAIRAFSYVPGFDHQDQANGAWKAFRRARDARPLGPPAGAGGRSGSHCD